MSGEAPMMGGPRKSPIIPNYSKARAGKEMVRAAAKRLRQSPHFETKVTPVRGVPGAKACVTAINDRTLGQFNDTAVGYGQSLGGVRVVTPHIAKDPARYALMLARAMTYKWILIHRMLADMQARGIAEVSDHEVRSTLMGGAKSLLVFDNLNSYFSLSESQKKSLFQQHGRHIERLGGKVSTAPDMYTGPAEMDIVASETAFVQSTTRDARGLNADPSPITAAGVWSGVKALLELTGIHNPSFMIQGVGKVGSSIVGRISREFPDADIFITDLIPGRMDGVVRKHGRSNITIIDPASEKIFTAATVLIPCGPDGVLNRKTTPLLRRGYVKIVAGAANDQYVTDEHGVPKRNIVESLHEAGIIVATDYALSGGGIMNITTELWRHINGPKPDGKRATELITRGVDMMAREIFALSLNHKVPFEYATEKIVHETYAAFCRANGILQPPPVLPLYRGR